jgi:heptosyltransferase-3
MRIRFTGFLTGSMVKGADHHKHIDVSPKKIKRILVSRPNHRLGNQLLMTPLIQELEQTFPEAKIDLFVKGGASFAIFQNYDSIDQIISLPKEHFKHLLKYLSVWSKLKARKYDLVVNGDKYSSSGNLCVKLARAPYKVFGDRETEMSSLPEEFQHIAKYAVYDFRQALDPSIYQLNDKEVPKLNIKLSADEQQKGKQLLKDLVGNDRPTICLFTNATGNKIYSSDWWMPFYKQLKTEFPEHNIVELLPIENTSQINFTAPNLYSKDLREMAAFIEATDLFITPDNGTMHLAASTDTPVIGFFKVTSIKKYKPYGGLNRAFDTKKTSIHDWIGAAHDILKK